MTPLPLLLATAMLLLVLLLPAPILASSCGISLNGNVCPVSRPETSPGAPLATCSGQGSCVFGACQCAAGWGDVDCSKPLRRTKIGTFVITQAALDDAPRRYVDMVGDTFDRWKASNLELPPQEIKDCLYYICKTPLVPNWNIQADLLPSSVQLKIINGGIRGYATIDVNIPNIPVDAYVSLSPGSGSCCTPGNVSVFATTGTCTVACDSSAGAFVSVNFKMIIDGAAYPTFDPVTGNITVDVPPGEVHIVLDPPDLGFQQSCDMASYPQLLANVVSQYIEPFGVTIANKFEVAFRDQVEAYANAFSETGSVANLSDSTFVEVYCTKGSFISNTMVVVEMEGYVKRSRFYENQPSCPLVLTTYVDTGVDAAILAPSYFDQFFETIEGVRMQTFATVRLTRSVLGSLFWMAKIDNPDFVRSATSISANFRVLDGIFVGEAHWMYPAFGFPATETGGNLTLNTIRVSVPQGVLQMICNNTNLFMFAAQYDELTMDVNPFVFVNLTNPIAPGSPVYSMTAQIKSWDASHLNMNLSAPVVTGVPNKLSRLLLGTVLDDKIDTTNQLLRVVAPIVPSDLSQFFPGPRAVAVHDYNTPGSDSMNGYLEMSTRCACVPTSQPVVTLDTDLYGRELVPRCQAACPPSPPSGRRRRVESTTAAHFEQRAREVRGSGNPLSPPAFVLPRSLAQSCTNNSLLLRQVVTGVLKCATSTNLNTYFASVSRAECMFELDRNFSSSGACDATSQFRQFQSCSATMAQLIPELYNYNCVEGPHFRCSDTLSSVLNSNCQCAVSYGVVVCNKYFLPGMVVLGAIIVAVIISLLGYAYIVTMLPHRSRMAVMFRVSLRSRDLLVLRLATVTCFICLAFCVGWVLEDPFRNFAQNIVRSNLYSITPWLTSTFDEFMIYWGIIVLFFLTLTCMVLLAITLFSWYVGRCIWIAPMDRYSKNGVWFVPSVLAVKVWNKEMFIMANILRLLVLIVMCVLAVPPMFFTFKDSIIIREPQFQGDVTATLTSNLTSIGTSNSTLETMRFVLGYTLLARFLAFISTAVIYVYHGAAPAAFSAAHLILFLMDRRQEVSEQQFRKYKDVLPPQDTSDLDRWRRILHLFIWFVHATGLLGSLVGAILVYQGIRAPAGWALAWLSAWIFTLPCVWLGSSRRFMLRYKKWGGAVLTLVYDGIFGVCTMVLVSLCPSEVGFVVWFGVILVVLVFVMCMTTLLSEFINIGEQISGNTFTDMKAAMGRIKLMERMGVDVSSNPALLHGNFDWDHQVGSSPATAGPGASKRSPPPPPSPMLLRGDSGGAMGSSNSRLGSPQQKKKKPADNNTVTGSRVEQSSGNPLFEAEKRRVGGGGSSPSPSPPPQGFFDQDDSPVGQPRRGGGGAGNAPSPRAHAAGQQHVAAVAQRANNVHDDSEEEAMMRAMASPTLPRTAAPRASRFVREEDVGASSMAMAAHRVQTKVQRQSVRMGRDPEVHAPMVPDRATKPQSAQESNEPVGDLPPLTAAERREQERIRRRISKRLAARGVQGDAAKQLTDQIVRFNQVRAQQARQQQQRFRQGNNTASMAFSEASSASGRAAGRTLASAAAPVGPSSASSFRGHATDVGSSSGVSGAAPGRIPVRPNSPPPRLDAKPSASSQRPADSRSRSPASPSSPSGRSVAGRSPGGAGAARGMSPPPPGSSQASAKPAKTQAQMVSANPVMDDAFARQFDPAFGQQSPQYTWDGDDSFFSFMRDLCVQLGDSLRGVVADAGELVGICCSSARGGRVEDGSRYHPTSPKHPSPTNTRRHLQQQWQGRIVPRERSFQARFGIWYRFRFLPYWARLWDLIIEGKENSDPATFGLRVPFRRAFFMTGILAMLVALAYKQQHRQSVNALKTLMFDLLFEQFQPLGQTFSFPEFSNMTAFVDEPLRLYVQQLNFGFALLWFVLGVFVMSFIVDILYGSFGRDMEEKRWGITFARWMLFSTLPIILIYVVVPAGPDYIGISLKGLDLVVPKCADQITGLILDVSSGLFGLGFASYLSFNVYVALVLVCPSISRAFVFVIGREILELRELNHFEPRKQFHLTTRRLRSARFVWRVFPFMSPPLLYIPLMLLIQLLGQIYVSVLLWLFFVLPIILGSYGRKDDRSAHGEQVVRILDWFAYNTVWNMVYFAPFIIIFIVEGTRTHQFSLVVSKTIGYWYWWVTIYAVATIAVVLVGDVLYLFMASDDELEADRVINQYIEAIQEEAIKLEQQQLGDEEDGGINRDESR